MAHEHFVADTDARFRIDAITRNITSVSGKTALMQGDHNSERFTLELSARTIEEHDMSLCNSVEIHYINIDAVTKEQHCGVYEVEDMHTDPENENAVILTWLISNNATRYAGSLNFVVKFKCVADDGTVDYVWNSGVYSGISVSDGINNSDAIAEEYADILEQWYRKLIATNSKPIVNIVYDSANGYSADKTYAEIWEEMSAGNEVIAIYGRRRFTALGYEPGSIFFYEFVTTSNLSKPGRFCCSSNNIWTYSEVEDNESVMVVKINWDRITYSSDKTFTEISAAHNDGKAVIAYWGGRMFSATSRDPGAVFFEEFVRSSASVVGEFVCGRGDVWTYSAKDAPGGATDDHINELIDAKLAALTNVAEVGA